MPPSRIPLAVILAYALPALPLAVLTLPFAIVVPTFYATTLGLPLAAIGQVLLAVRLIDAISDPVVGVLADRWRPRFGRRRLWFALSIPVTVAAVWAVFVPPESAGVWWLFGFATLLSTGMTLSLIPYWAWGAELSGDYTERNRIAGAREGVVVLGTLIATATPAIATAMGATDGGLALMMLAGFVLVLLPLTGLIAVWRVPEPRDFTQTRLDWRAGLKHLAANRPFVRLLAAFVLNGFANGLPATLFLFFVNERLESPDSAGILLFAYFLAGVAGVPLWTLVANRIGKHRAWSIAMLFNVAVFATVPLLGPGDSDWFLAVCLLTGIALGADLVLPSSIQADVIDVDTASTGEQRTGTYVAAWGLATKLALALAVGIAFPLLDWAGFQANGGPQPEGGLTMLVALYAGVPLFAKLAAIGLMWNFPVDRAAQETLRATIEGNPVTSSR
ncbi:MFS transporter [Chthonobacter albigriseus]|uniref:MFS transporter n=1 Tax=Chthonobacter albigriseus TaxID=1683161 RepID=UPI0015EFD5D8|nr:MFS transporter [Chthonobacter albigriseus]